MKYNMRNIKAFTLIELVITIIILGILIVLVAGSYQTYLKEAKTTEGIMLASSISKVQTIYQREYGAYLPIANASYSEIPEIEARYNKYFKLFYMFPVILQMPYLPSLRNQNQILRPGMLKLFYTYLKINPIK